MSFSFKIQSTSGSARAGVFVTPHGDVETPAFMPVGTLATVKALDPDARRRTVRVPGGYQRVLDYHDIDARFPTVRIAQNGQPTSVEINPLYGWLCELDVKKH